MKQLFDTFDLFCESIEDDYELVGIFLDSANKTKILLTNDTFKLTQYMRKYKVYSEKDSYGLFWKNEGKWTMMTPELKTTRNIVKNPFMGLYDSSEIVKG